MRKLLAPLWHPPEVSYAGGFYRAQRILELLDKSEPYVVASDTFPIDVAQIRRYPSSALVTGSAALFKLVRAINWLWSTLAIIAIGLFWRERIEFVYAGPSEILPISLGGLVLGKLRGVPIILCNQNVRDTELWSLNRVVHKMADGVITVSEALAAELRREGITEPILIGTNGADDRSVPKTQARFDAIFVGRHTAAKGIFDLLDVWRIVCDRKADAKLTCVGAATPEMWHRLQAMVQDLHLQGNVDLMGPLEEAKKWDLYAASRCCVFPSHVEGWGIVPVEAHLAGLPVIAYQLPAYEATIVHSPAARLVPVGDKIAFADAVLRELAQPERDEAAIQRWARQFTWVAAAEREEKLFDEVLRMKRPAA